MVAPMTPRAGPSARMVALTRMVLIRKLSVAGTREAYSDHPQHRYGPRLAALQFLQQIASQRGVLPYVAQPL
jgi:hypothetical protein